MNAKVSLDLDDSQRTLSDDRTICVHEALGVDQLSARLRGEIALGAYLLDKENRARFIVLDADDAQSGQLCALAHEQVPVYLEGSNRGGHLWLFFAPRSPGETPARLATAPWPPTRLRKWTHSVQYSAPGRLPSIT